ncbi:hypothetical protein ACFQQB_44270 [Nonomuraea rubra]
MLAAALPRLLPRDTLRATAGLPAVVALLGLTTGALPSTPPRPWCP